MHRKRQILASHLTPSIYTNYGTWHGMSCRVHSHIVPVSLIMPSLVPHRVTDTADLRAYLFRKLKGVWSRGAKS